jgi:hypothetical protein
MYVIETDLGRFEADSEKAAKKLLRAAKKDKAKADAIHDAKYQAAIADAYKEAYSLYERKARSNEFPQGWRILPVESRQGMGHPCCELADSEATLRKYNIETDKGRAIVGPLFDRITHYLENGAGFVKAVCIDNNDAELFAVGVSDGVAAWVPVYGISAAEFSQPSASESAA